ncbi:hypothetical protein [Pseudoduganella namucuonensis]|uniref:Uncharacterized protein n=1 Tax=Pseudoduganella namucuonensis TaxID=1035707 RepID=A0A1I7LL35_9BURK|nr:hypothetical protein [Pseudoduganella namucuonensis]SFV10313.1 hypothetical protein SAMN05216552_103174 [Pseudoduganella namucuonensis]
MKSKLIKLSAAAVLMTISAVALASNMDCCASIECCLRMLADCC